MRTSDLNIIARRLANLSEREAELAVFRALAIAKAFRAARKRKNGKAIRNK